MTLPGSKIHLNKVKQAELPQRAADNLAGDEVMLCFYFHKN